MAGARQEQLVSHEVNACQPRYHYIAKDIIFDFEHVRKKEKKRWKE